MSIQLAEGRIFRIPNEEITWAGDCPWTGGYCFGTESGAVFFFGDAGCEPNLEYTETLAEDPINGIAFCDEFIGVSTRSEVLVHRRVSAGVFELAFSGPGGAHGILGTPDGQFLAPMGLEGLLCVDVAVNGGPRVWNERVNGVPLNHYSLTRLGNSAGKEILACAGRTDGLLRLDFNAGDERSLISRLMAPDVDFVDVCSLRSARWPFAVAALCLDRSLLLVRDLLTDERPQTLRIDGIRGTPYGILCALGHLFVLTSQHVTVFPNLACWYLDHERFGQPLQYRQLSVRAVDIFITHEEELLVLTDDGVEIDSISQLVGSHVASNQTSLPSTDPAWIEKEGSPEIVASSAQWTPVPA
jgi:hypothetical protein